MRIVGLLLLMYGLGPVFMDRTGREFDFLLLADQWGAEIGLAIRTTMVVFGVAFLLSSKKPAGPARDRPPAHWTPARRADGRPDPMADLYNKPPAA